MNNYPDLPWIYAQAEGRGARHAEKREALGGEPHWRIFGTVRRPVIPLVHPRLSRAERDALFAFFDAQVEPFAFIRTRGGVVETLTVFFDDEPEEKYLLGNRFEVAVRLKVI